MTTTLTILLLVCVLGFLCEWINATLGMGYGTILSPTLLILGFDPLTAVPAILISQGVSAVIASYYHHELENVDLSRSSEDGTMSENLTTGVWIAALGIGAVCFASFVGVHLISKEMLSTYIGGLVCAMGFFILIGFTFDHASWKMKLVAIVSAFNKGLSGGGFGPLVTGGQMMLGQNHKNAVGVTMFAEAPICIAGFLAYWYLKGIVAWDVMVALTLGAVLASRLGAHTTKHLSHKYLQALIACALILLGGLVLLRRYGFLTFSISM